MEQRKVVYSPFFGRSYVHPSESHIPGATDPNRDNVCPQSLGPVRISASAVQAADFSNEAHRQSAAIAASPRASDDQAFIDAVSDQNDA